MQAEGGGGVPPSSHLAVFYQHISSVWSEKTAAAWSNHTLCSWDGGIRGKSSQTLRIFSTRQTWWKEGSCVRQSPFYAPDSLWNLKMEMLSNQPKTYSQTAAWTSRSDASYKSYHLLEKDRAARSAWAPAAPSHSNISWWRFQNPSEWKLRGRGRTYILLP